MYCQLKYFLCFQHFSIIYCIFNYIFIQGLDIAPGWLLIKFKEKVGRRSSIAFKIEHEELLKLPNKILKLLMLNEYYTPFE